MTNYHVVHGAHKLTVELADGRKLPAKVVGSDVSLDLALIKVEAGKLSVADLGDSDKLKIGQLVIAIGKPYGHELRGSTVTVGIVSSLGQRFDVFGSGHGVSGAPEGWIQTDADINPGNSGGPLVDERGLVIGINSRGLTGAPGMNFAVPINVAKRVTERFIGLPRAGGPWTGIGGLDITREAARYYNMSHGGILVTRVTPNGPANKAGIISGDVIIEIDGVPLETMDEFQEEIQKRRIGERVELTIRRKQNMMNVKMALEEAPPQVSSK